MPNAYMETVAGPRPVAEYDPPEHLCYIDGPTLAEALRKQGLRTPDGYPTPDQIASQEQVQITVAKAHELGLVEGA